jgi:hypothetical protein
MIGLGKVIATYLHMQCSVYADASVSNNQQDMNHLAGGFLKSFFNNSFAKSDVI